jgi:ABC-type Mn2+/Zn2+ transport system ATPase subunit
MFWELVTTEETILVVNHNLEKIIKNFNDLSLLNCLLVASVNRPWILLKYLNQDLQLVYGGKVLFLNFEAT